MMDNENPGSSHPSLMMDNENPGSSGSSFAGHSHPSLMMDNENPGSSGSSIAGDSHLSFMMDNENQGSSGSSIPIPLFIDPAQDLSPELLQAGWGKFWSKREGRPYYFNKLTNESLWEVPTIGAIHNLLTDPLCIDIANGANEESASSRLGRQGSTEINPGIALMQQRVNSELCDGSPLRKKANLNFKPFWNFDVPTNVVIRERAPLNMPPSHPEVESFRCALVMQMRQVYQEMCHQQEGIDAPVDSFNRWLLERKVIDKGKDPFLPSQCSPELSQSMIHEIMNDIPIRLVRPKVADEARRLLLKYIRAAKKMIESRKASHESCKLIKLNVEETFRWLRSRHNISYEDYLERLAQLKRRCEPCLNEVAAESVQGIVQNIYNLSVENCQRIQDKTWEVFKVHNITEGNSVPEPIHPRLSYCCAVQLSIPSPRLPFVERVIENEVVYLYYRSETLMINQAHFWKLEEMYGLNCKDDPKFDNFLARVWCLLKRYQTYFGSVPDEGKGNQGAISPALMESLHRVFSVTFECFASPFNCYFRQFCSAFPDTDGFFGSRGSFLKFCPTSGSFEANPPFSEELMVATVKHIERLLGGSSEPLSFVVFIPDWRDPPTEALIRLESSRFKRKQFVCPPFEHEYRNGFQHLPSARHEMSSKAVFGTLVVFLQNDAGCTKWTPTAEKIKELIIATQT